MTELLQSTAQTVVGRGYLSSDHIATATGLDPAITISKNGGDFANPAAGASVMTEIESTGWYKFALGTGDTDTLGPLLVRGTHATMDNIEVVFQVVAVSVAQTGDAYARLGAPAGASVSADIAAIEAQTDDIGAAGAGLTAMPWNAAWDAEVQSEAQDAITASGLATAAALATVAGYVDTEVASILAAVDTEVAALIATVGVAGAGLTALATQASVNTIDDFLDTEVAAILADTNELQTDLVNGGRLDLLIDAIKAKTDNLPSDPADESAVEAAITAATSPLATAAALAALNDISVADIIAGVSEGSLDLAEILRVMLAALAGQSTGGGTATVTFRDVAAAKARITATLDASGNRTAITLDGS